MYKVCWIVLCKNEIDILPFVSEYWKKLGVNNVVVYDNGSTDGSLEYLNSLPFVEIRHFDSEGQNDIIQKELKEKAYLEFKDKYDIIVISDMDEVFYMTNLEAVWDDFIKGGYNCLVTPIFSLCESFKPQPEEGKLLHQQCTKFYKQKMNHMQGFKDVSKISIFNCKVTDKVSMSVGQHYVYTNPSMKIMLAQNGFCLHIDKGFGLDYKFNIRQKMNDNLSETNRKNGMCVEYGNSFEALKKEYEDNQKKSININDYYCNN